MEIQCPEIFEPEDDIQDPEAPNFYGRYIEIDSLEVLSVDDDKPNSWIQDLVGQTLECLKSIDRGTLRMNEEQRYVIDDLIQDVGDNAMRIIDEGIEKRLVGLANLLRENGRLDDVVAILTSRAEDGTSRPKFPNNSSAMLILGLIAEKNGAWNTMVEYFMNKDGSVRFPGQKECLRLLTFALNQSERHEDTVRCIEAGMKNGKRSQFDYASLQLNYARALYELGEYQKIIELCMKDGKIIIPAYLRIPTFVGIYCGALAECGRHEEALEILSARNGRCMFPDNLVCMREYAYALIQCGYLDEAAGFLRWIERESRFKPVQFQSVRNALRRAARW